jgi:hypothetical protein
MNIKFNLIFCWALLSFVAFAQTEPSKGMKTYSPYTPEQIKAFNDQPISPVEGPFGPVAPNAQERRAANKQSFDSKFYSQPEGEEEAEAQEMQSANPYQPVSPTIKF